jgi:uncharacterized protein YbjT (DUF2867 family)
MANSPLHECSTTEATTTILGLGTTGTVGSTVLQELRAANYSVRAGCHSQRRAEGADVEGDKTVMVDLADAATLPPALEGVDSVFLISATGPDQTRQELNVVAVAQTAGVKRIVKLSVWRADEQLTPIARSHRPVEEALEASGMAWTFLRPNFYMQNFQRQMASDIKNEGVIAQPVSNAAISFVDTRDVARVAAAVLTSEGHVGQTYDITGPQALSYEDVATVFSTVLRKPVRFIGLSDAEAKAGMLRREMPESYADALIKVNRAYRNGGAESVSPTVRALTGRDPINLERFVRDHRGTFL